MRRLLALVPYVVQHPGAKLDDISRLFGVSEKDLLEDLTLLFMTGLPPYGPGDLVNVQIEDGRVWIDMADYFSRPVRLTRTEALSIYLRGTALLATPGISEAPALSAALEKLEKGIGEEALGNLPGKVEAAEVPADEFLEVVRTAVEKRERLEIEYYSASRDELSLRRIDPEEVFSAIGQWYVVAWDSEADAERMFRVDRIKRVERTGEAFESRGLAGAGRPLYEPSEQDLAVRLLLKPEGRWVADYFAIESAKEMDGDLEVVLPTGSLAWASKLVLRLGSDCRVLDPPALRDLAARLAEETLALYEDA
ncbi:MAG: WYL domain-containing protein [Actinomycetota bacterium]